MWADLQAPLFSGLLAATATTLGLIVVARFTEWSERYSGLFALAAGGMLFTLTVLHIAPSALWRSAIAPYLILVGFLGGLFLHQGVNSIFGDPDKISHRVNAITPLIAIAIHSLLDGVIYAVTFVSSTQSGIYAALSLILHEFPEGVIAFAILRRANVSTQTSFLFAFLAAAATTPLGVLASGPFLHGLGDAMIGNLFAVSAGLLIFVATGPLMAPLQDERSMRGFLAIAAGAFTAILIMLFPLHSEGEGASNDASTDRKGHIH